MKLLEYEEIPPHNCEQLFVMLVLPSQEQLKRHEVVSRMSGAAARTLSSSWPVYRLNLIRFSSPDRSMSLPSSSWLLASRLYRLGGQNPASPRQPLRPKVVTDVLGTFRYLCFQPAQPRPWL